MHRRNLQGSVPPIRFRTTLLEVLNQNRCQNIFNRGLCLCRLALYSENISIWGLGALFGRLSPQNPPIATGLFWTLILSSKLWALYGGSLSNPFSGSAVTECLDKLLFFFAGSAISGSNYVISMPLPFIQCGSTVMLASHNSTAGGQVVENTVWMNHFNVTQSSLSLDMPVPVASFRCLYPRQYSVLASIRPVWVFLHRICVVSSTSTVVKLKMPHWLSWLFAVQAAWANNNSQGRWWLGALHYHMQDRHLSWYMPGWTNHEFGCSIHCWSANLHFLCGQTSECRQHN